MKKTMMIMVMFAAIMMILTGCSKETSEQNRHDDSATWIHETVLHEDVIHEDIIHENIITENVITWDNIPVNSWD